MEGDHKRVMVQYACLRDPKQPKGVDNDWIKRRMFFPSNGSLEELVTKISNKTEIPREFIDLYYKMPDMNPAADQWLLLKDEDDFEVMMDGANIVEIQATNKQISKEELLLGGNVAAHVDTTSQTNQQVDHDFSSSNSDHMLCCPPAAAKSLGYEYDVFISFRGDDIRKGFAGHLYSSLLQYGIRTFIDEKELEKGQKIDEIFYAIENSVIFVPVFSKNYADSPWCLKEISKMVECHRLMLPIFYDVEPTDVRHQTGPFQKAFSDYDEDAQVKAETVNLWRKNLKEAAGISSYCLQSGFNGREVDLLKAIVKQILDKTREQLYEVAEHPVGVDVHTANVMEILYSRPDQKEVLMVGIVGMGGIGKTTIVKSLFNQLSPQFDGSCLLLDTRERWDQGRQDFLKEKILSDILKVNVDDTSGDYVIEQRLQNKKVLLILDDVNAGDQLKKLAGDRNWFGNGSRIIITTRDNDLLIKHKVSEHEIYRPKPLTVSQSLKLFSRHAFHEDEPPEKFLKLSKDFVATTGGLPLALKVLGSELFYVFEERKWEDMLSKHKKVPHNNIQQRLRLSFDKLDDPQKSIFLDIACSHHIKESLAYATYMWEAQGFYPTLSLSVLELKSLITVDKVNDTISMHDQLIDMGRAIARESEPTKRSRQWDPKEIEEQFRDNNEANCNIEVIDKIDGKRCKIKADMRCMSKLRMLCMDGDSVDLQSSTLRFPTSLQYLQWTNMPTNLFTFNLEFERLVVLELEGTYRGYDDPIDFEDPVCPQLKVLILKHDALILRRFDGMPCLEMLVVEEAFSLDKIHESISCLKHLEFMAIREEKDPDDKGYNDSKLMELPDEIGDLESLKHFELSECTLIRTIPRSIGNLKKLEYLKLESCESLIDLPEEIGGMDSLRHLDLRYCESLTRLPNSIGSLKNIQTLDASYCFELVELPDSLSSLQKLQRLSLQMCFGLRALPHSLAGMTELLKLDLTSCHKLRVLPPLPSSLTSLKCGSCSSCETLPEMSNLMNLRELVLGSSKLHALPPLPSSLTSLNCHGCSYLETLPELSNLMNLMELDLGSCKRLHDLPPLPPSLTSLRCSGCYALETLPDMSNLTNLRKLDLSACNTLRALPPLPSSLISLDCVGCHALESLPEPTNLTNLGKLCLHSCESLRDLPPLPTSLEDVDQYFENHNRPRGSVRFSAVRGLSVPDHRSVAKLHGTAQCHALLRYTALYRSVPHCTSRYRNTSKNRKPSSRAIILFPNWRTLECRL